MLPPLPQPEVRRDYRAGSHRLACTEEPRLSNPRPIKETKLQTGLVDLLRYDFISRDRRHCLIHQHSDGFIEERRRTVRHEKVAPAGMVAAEIASRILAHACA